MSNNQNEKINTAPLTDWEAIDALEREELKIPKRKKGGMKLKRAIGNTVGQIFLTALSILWIVPLI